MTAFDELGGISSMKRDGSVAWYSPKTRRRAAPVSTSRALRARHPDVAQPPLLLELLLVVARPRVRKQPLLQAGDDDDRELEALGAVQRHHQHAGVPRPASSSTSDSSDRLIDEPAERRLGLAALVLARRRHQLRRGSRCAPRRPRCARRAGPAGSRSGPAPCRSRSTPTRSRAISVRLDDQIAKGRQRRSRATRRTAARRGRARCAPTANSLDSAGCQAGRKQRRQRRRLGCRPAPNRLERLHHALADAARRHVDHAPQAHVVVRVDDQPQVGERVLDFLALVEPHAADDLVGDALAHQRVFNRARLRVGPIQHRDRVSTSSASALRAVRVMKSASSSSSPPRK